MEDDIDPDDPDLEDGVDEDLEMSYITTSTPWVQSLVTLLQERHRTEPFSCVVLSSMSFDEVGLPTAEAMASLMKPSERAGSKSRFLVRITAGSDVFHYLVKEVDDRNGETERDVGFVLYSLGIIGSFIPAVCGFKAPAYHSDRLESYYIVVPWKTNALPLDSFVRNKFPERLSLTTSQILRAFAPVLQSMLTAFNRARFLHLDVKSNQVLVLAPGNENPLTLYLIDFGLSAINAVVDGRAIKHEARQVTRSTKTFGDEVSSLAKGAFHNLVTANSPGKDRDLVKQWNRWKLLYERQKTTIENFIAWLGTA